MAGDGVHGAIGRKMKNKSSIINFLDFIDICKSSQVNINPIVMENRDFRIFQKHVRSRNTVSVEMPLLSNIVEVEFRKGRLLTFRTII